MLPFGENNKKEPPGFYKGFPQGQIIQKEMNQFVAILVKLQVI